MQWLELIGGLVVAAFLVIGIVRYFSVTAAKKAVDQHPASQRWNDAMTRWERQQTIWENTPPHPDAPKQPQEKDSNNAPK